MQDVLLAKALRQASSPMFILDKGSAVVWCNPAYAKLIGGDEQSLLGSTPFALRSSPENAKFLLNLWKVVRAGNSWIGELDERAADGEIRHMETVFTPLPDATGQPAFFLVTEHDITQRKIEYEQLLRLANYDRLTGLANRGLFASLLDHTLSQCERTGGRCAILFIDLDGFKAVNDTYGHDMGDKVLVEAGHIIKRNVRDSDVAARFGGDEFAVILDRVDTPASAGEVGQKIIDALRLPMAFGGTLCSLGASIGVAVYGVHGYSQDQLRSAADAAMYGAKRAGKNCWRMAQSLAIDEALAQSA